MALWSALDANTPLCFAAPPRRMEDYVVCGAREHRAVDDDCRSTVAESEIPPHYGSDVDLPSESEGEISDALRAEKAKQWRQLVDDGRRVKLWADLEEDEHHRQEAENQEPNAPGYDASEDPTDDSQKIDSKPSGGCQPRPAKSSKASSKKQAVQAAAAATTTDDCRGSGVSKPKGKGKGSSKKFQCQFTIGIEDDDAFHVVKRIIGQGGEHVKRIVRKTKAKLRLRGRGSRFLEGEEQQESTDDLMMCISSEDAKGFEFAKRLFSQLLESIYASYRTFCTKSGLPKPSVGIKIHNGYREGSW